MKLKESSWNERPQQSVGILGISMGNSQFSEAYIRELFKEMRGQYTGLAVMLPDVPAQSTLQALGYPPNKAVQKARLAFNGIVNKCRGAIDTLGIPDVRMVSWSNRNGHIGEGTTPVQNIQIEENPTYLDAYQKMQDLYSSNQVFAKDVRETTSKVLTGKVRQDGRETTPTDIEIGVQFLLQELAFITSATGILRVSSTDYIYHELMPVLQKLYQNAYTYSPAKDTGFSVYN